MPYALDLLDTTHWYRQYRRLIAHRTSLHGDAIRDIDYDELVAAPRPVMERLLAFCGLPWDDALPAVPPDPHKRADAERLAGSRADLHALVGPLAPLRAPLAELRAALAR